MSQTIELNLENLNIAHWKSPREFDLPVGDVAQIRQLENAAFEKVDSFLMMQAAGFRTAQHIIQEVGHRPEAKPRFVVLAGPGNNGGDACLVAGKLHLAGYQVAWVQIKGDKTASKDRQQAEQWCRSIGLTEQILPIPEGLTGAGHNPLQQLTPPNTWIVDGLLGIGCDRAPSPLFEQLIKAVNELRPTVAGVRILSLDCPSGLDCSTGLAPGVAVKADCTYTYIALKTGLLCNQGKDLTGEVRVESLGCDNLIASGLTSLVLGDQSLQTKLPGRQHQHHKGSFGSLSVIGGAAGMVGAALLSARTAVQLGAGRVAMSLISELDQRMPDVQVQGFQPYLDPLYPELMNKTLDENFSFSDCLVVGPGMGESFDSLQTLHRIVDEQSHKPMVWDADALNLLAAHPDLQDKLVRARSTGKDTPPPLILTPHPLEAARLLASTSAEVNTNRVQSAQALANRFQCTVVLKGAGTIIADPQGGVLPNCTINCTGGPMLATAGSGDVLAGVIGALMAQSCTKGMQTQATPLHGSAGHETARLGVWLHGLACEAIQGEKYAPAVCSASGLILRIQAHFNRLMHEV